MSKLQSWLKIRPVTYINTIEGNKPESFLKRDLYHLCQMKKIFLLLGSLCNTYHETGVSNTDRFFWRFHPVFPRKSRLTGGIKIQCLLLGELSISGETIISETSVTHKRFFSWFCWPVRNHISHAYLGDNYLLYKYSSWLRTQNFGVNMKGNRSLETNAARVNFINTRTALELH